ncbi:patatin-like phospholipase family protein [Caldimonas manganoxidans]|uniref:patatin-like phospholipase family protein n=1 Tax=Caldimonas manganoxidans TaxID=196015 RepID=UPI0003809407|nr:patatin-like phospholipase family protein [Caldimonas manganoxidans]
MTLGTAFGSLLDPPEEAAPRTALVLMGGGARTAYQVGVLLGLTHLLGRRPGGWFDIVVGTSAGALNAACLVDQAPVGAAAVERLAQLWMGLHADQVYRVQPWRMTPGLRWAGLLSPAWLLRRLPRWLLDPAPLTALLGRVVRPARIAQALDQGHLQAWAVTASSYTTGVHWTFYQAARRWHRPAWQRPGRRAVAQAIGPQHLLASAAIPFLFPAVPLEVEGRTEYFGDGSMRQIAPLSPAFNLGATRILAIGVGQPERNALGAGSMAPGSYPSLAQIATHAMASVFHDTLEADVEQAERVNAGLRRWSQQGGMAPYRAVQVLAMQPSRSLDELALAHVRALPEAVFGLLKMLGGTQAAGAALASYLLFEPPFVQALIELGRADVWARRAQLEAFFEGRPVPGA